MPSTTDLDLETVDVTDDATLRRWLAVHNAVDPRPLTLAGYRAELTAATVHLELIAVEDGRDVGVVETGWGAISAESRTTFIHVWVLPDARRHGIGSALVERCLDLADEHGMTLGRSSAVDGDAGAVAFATRYGLEIVGAGQVGDLDLTPEHAATTVALPDGIELSSLADRPDLERAVFDLDVLVQPEVPTLALEPVPTFEAWRAQTTADEGFVPALSLLALRGEQVVGTIQVYDNAEGTAFIGMTAVHPDARRLGIARALKAELAGRAARTGWKRIETFNDGSNERMRALNIALGYTYLPRMVTFKGRLVRP